MFEFMDLLNFGREVEAHGEKWLSLKYLQNGCHLAIRPKDSLPCQVMLIKENEKKNDNGGG